MKQKEIFFLLTFIPFTFCKADQNFIFSIGANHTSTLNTQSIDNVGQLFGIEYEFFQFKKFHLSTGLFLNHEQFFLKQKKIEPNGWTFDHYEVSLYDINYSVFFFEIPFSLKRYFYLINNLWIDIHLSTTIQLINQDKSMWRYSSSFTLADLSEEERINYSFDYRTTTMSEYSHYSGSPMPISVGFGIGWKRYELLLKYYQKSVERINNVILNEKIHSYQLYVRIRI